MNKTYNNAEKVEYQKLVDELTTISSTWNEIGLVPKVQQDRCRQIGVRLHEIGDIPLMQEAYYRMKAMNRCASVIQAYWDGIGEWRW